MAINSFCALTSLPPGIANCFPSITREGMRLLGREAERRAGDINSISEARGQGMAINCVCAFPVALELHVAINGT